MLGDGQYLPFILQFILHVFLFLMQNQQERDVFQELDRLKGSLDTVMDQLDGVSKGIQV